MRPKPAKAAAARPAVQVQEAIVIAVMEEMVVATAAASEGGNYGFCNISSVAHPRPPTVAMQ
jgi:hypothetical protein